MEVRTEHHIISDMLQWLVEYEFDMSRDYDGHPSCPYCNATSSQTYIAVNEIGYRQTFSIPPEDRKHEPNCLFDKIIREARALISVENELRKAKGEEMIKTWENL